MTESQKRLERELRRAEQLHRSAQALFAELEEQTETLNAALLRHGLPSFPDLPSLEPVAFSRPAPIHPALMLRA